MNRMLQPGFLVLIIGIIGLVGPLLINNPTEGAPGVLGVKNATSACAFPDGKTATPADIPALIGKLGDNTFVDVADCYAAQLLCCHWGGSTMSLPMTEQQTIGYQAARHLVTIGDEAIPSLVDVVQNESRLPQMRAIWALGGMHAYIAVDLLGSLLSRNTQDELRYQATIAAL